MDYNSMEENIKLIQRDIENTFKSKVFKNNNDDRTVLEKSINRLFYEYKNKNIIDSNISVRITGEGNDVYIHYYYYDRELYITGIDDLINFNPLDYLYLDKNEDGNTIINRCNSTIVFKLTT